MARLCDVLAPLGRTLEHQRVSSREALATALDEGRWHLAFSDGALRELAAKDVLALTAARTPRVPLLVVARSIDETTFELVAAGARDCVLKSDATRLLAAVRRELRDRDGGDALGLARFRRLVEASADGILLTDLDGRFLYVSPGAERIFGRPASELLGKLGSSFHAPNDTGPPAGSILAQLRGRPGARVAHPGRRISRPDGSTRLIEATVTNALEDPSVRAIISNIRDVTDRVDAEAALDAERRRFGRLFEVGIIGVVVTDLEGEVTDANDTYLTIVGRTREDLLAKRFRWTEILVPENAAIDGAVTQRLRETGLTAPWETEIRRPDGTRVPILIGAAMLDDHACISFMADLSERRRTQRALEEVGRQLVHAQKMEAIGTLAGGVAHDFNNHLMVILAHADVALEDTRPGDPLATDLQQIRGAADRAATLTRQLLTFSRRQAFEPRVVDLGDVIDGMREMLGRLLGETITLRVSARGPARVRVDPTGMEQVVMNLAVNARDAMPRGGSLALEVGSVTPPTGSPMVTLVARDDGAGMDEATRSRVFEPFFTTKERGKGTGLGLSTAFGLVEQCGGRISVTSAPGRGTTFTIELPRVDAAVDPRPTRAAPRGMSGTETLLVVEDDDAVREVTRSVLTRAGYHVLDARSAGEALLSSERHPGGIELLVTDVVMPQMSGPELATRLRQTRSEIRVLCMSGYIGEDVRRAVRDAGYDFVQKPVSRAVLLRRVREVLDAPRRRPLASDPV